MALFNVNHDICGEAIATYIATGDTMNGEKLESINVTHSDGTHPEPYSRMNFYCAHCAQGVHLDDTEWLLAG